MFLASASTAGGAPIFARPLHLVRRIDDPITRKSTTVDEYCAGNRIVSLRGARVTMLDFDRGVMTEIDHAAHTYSVTSFAEVAAARAAIVRMTPANGPAAGASWKPLPNAAVAATRAGSEAFSLSPDPEGETRLDVVIDRSVALSRAAVEVLIGAAWPAVHNRQHDAVLSVAAPRPGGRASVLSSSADVYGLPASQTLRSAGELVVTNTVLRVNDAVVPPELLAVDPGARRVESDVVRLTRELAALDTLPARAPQP